MKPTLTLLLACIVLAGKAQTKTDSVFTHPLWETSSNMRLIGYDDYWHKSDTLQVVAYCLVDFDKAKFKWIKMYAITSRMQGATVINNVLKLYPEYLMSDRKTKSIYKVAYCITK